MSDNFSFLIYSFLIIYIITSSNVFSFPFYNVQIAELSNGQKLIIHKLGIDIVDKDYNQYIRNEIIFSNEEQISLADKMKNVIIKKFEDGYLICLINDKTYIFDNLGNFLSKKENINLSLTAKYYSLNIKDNYHFFIGIISDDKFYLYYYLYKSATKETLYLKGMEGIQIVESSWVFGIGTTYYSFQDIGINYCHMMTDGEKGETLACILMLYYEREYYWHIKFFNINDNNQIIEDPNYTSIQEKVLYNLLYFKAEVNSDKNILFICSYLTLSGDLCLFFDLKKKILNQ